MNTTGFWLILLATALYGVVHSILASNESKRFAEAKFGAARSQRLYRLMFAVLAIITLIPILAMIALLPDATLYTIPNPWRWLTLAIQALALIGILIVVLQTGAMRFIGVSQLFDSNPSPTGANPERLIVSGFYRWVRHPLYTFSFLLLWLSPVMTWNLLAFYLCLSAYMLAGAYFSEEPKLIEQFGDDYIEYRRRTPMIIPGLKFNTH